MRSVQPGSAHPPFLGHVSCGNTDQPGEALNLCMQLFKGSTVALKNKQHRYI